MLEWLQNYKKNWLRDDISAGITVGIMLIPQGMAYATIAGLPPIYGLYAAFLPQTVYAVFGSSRYLSVGPAAIIALLAGASISRIATAGTANYFHLIILLALLVGAIQLLMGVFRLGFIMNFLSRPVISGYTSAAAIIIAMSQTKYLLGVEISASGSFLKSTAEILSRLDTFQAASLFTGLSGILLIVVLKKINRRIPSSLIAILLATFMVYMFRPDQAGLPITGEIPAGIPKPVTPHLTAGIITQLLPAAMVIALVSFLESISIGKSLQIKGDAETIKPNRELLALGLSNITSSFFRGFPVSGGMGRSAVNKSSGARTNLSAIVSALLIGTTLLFFTPFFYYLPKSILAAIIIVAVYDLFDWKHAKNLWETDREDFVMMLVTFLATLLLGVQAGFVSGIIISILLVLHHSAYPHIAVLGRLPETNVYRNVTRFPDTVTHPDVLIFRFDARLYFVNINYFVNRVNKIIRSKGPDLRVIIFNAQSVSRIDSTALEGLETMIRSCRKRHIEFYVTNLIGPVRDIFSRSNFFDKTGQEYFQMDIPDALRHYNRKKKTDNESSSPQKN